MRPVGAVIVRTRTAASCLICEGPLYALPAFVEVGTPVTVDLDSREPRAFLSRAHGIHQLDSVTVVAGPYAPRAIPTEFLMRDGSAL